MPKIWWTKILCIILPCAAYSQALLKNRCSELFWNLGLFRSLYSFPRLNPELSHCPLVTYRRVNQSVGSNLPGCVNPMPIIRKGLLCGGICTCCAENHILRFYLLPHGMMKIHVWQETEVLISNVPISRPPILQTSLIKSASVSNTVSQGNYTASG